MVIPPFPRDMTPAETGTERKRIVNLMIAEITADNPKANLDRDKMTVAFMGLVNSAWTADRIADLESRVEHMAQQMAALESQPAPAPAKRALLKLRSGTDG